MIFIQVEFSDLYFREISLTGAGIARLGIASPKGSLASNSRCFRTRRFEADPEVVLLIATEPIPHSNVSRYKIAVSRTIFESWQRFELAHQVSSENYRRFHAHRGRSRIGCPRTCERVELPRKSPGNGGRRGIASWDRNGMCRLQKMELKTGHRKRLVRSTPAEGFHRGVEPRTKFNLFQIPAMPYLSLRKQDKRTNAYQLPWSKPKAILNKTTRSAR